MTQADVVRRYQEFDPETGAFTLKQNKVAYARRLGVHPSNLTRLYRGTIDRSPTLIMALLKTYPQSINEIMDAMLVEAAV